MCNLTLGLSGQTGMGYFLYPWGIILQGLAIVHFIRRRPDNYWIFVILFLGPFGAIIYLAVEALPDIGLVGQSFKVFPRRKRISQLEAAIINAILPSMRISYLECTRCGEHLSALSTRRMSAPKMAACFMSATILPV
jgi:hypothetical protein